MTADLSQASLLHLLYLAHAHGSLDTLFSIENGAQENMVDGGAGEVARRVARELGASVRLNTPVRAITQRHARVQVAGDEITVSARKAVVSVPPALALEIAAFTFGPVSQRVASLDADVRRKTVLDSLAARLGPRAASPSEYIETSWWTEEWSRGCSMAHFTLGTLTSYGHLLREPFGNVHWAGTETATVSHGAIDGAVRSGERAAAEILDRT